MKTKLSLIALMLFVMQQLFAQGHPKVPPQAQPQTDWIRNGKDTIWTPKFVGIKTNSPDAPLQVSGEIIADSMRIKGVLHIGDSSLSIAGNLPTGNDEINSNNGLITMGNHNVYSLPPFSRPYSQIKVGVGTQFPQDMLHVGYNIFSLDNYIRTDALRFPPPPGFPSITPSTNDGLIIVNNLGELRDRINFTGNATQFLNGNGQFISALTGANNGLSVSGSTVQLGGNPLLFNTDIPLAGNNLTFSGTPDTYPGKMGIGIIPAFPLTTTPISLQVNGSVSIYDGTGNTSLFFGEEQFIPNPNGVLGEWGIQYWPASAGGGGLNFWKPSGSTGVGGNNFLFLSDNGNVGVGTPSPSAKLDVLQNNGQFGAVGVRAISNNAQSQTGIKAEVSGGTGQTAVSGFASNPIAGGFPLSDANIGGDFQAEGSTVANFGVSGTAVGNGVQNIGFLKP